VAARTPREALEALVSPLRDVVGCITSIGLRTDGINPDRAPHTIDFLGQDVIRLERRGIRPPILFLVSQGYALDREADGRWSARTTRWVYQVKNSDQRELFAYHWHPVGRSHVTAPHLHISGRTEPAELGDVHFPTGPVTLADVVRLLIRDFQVRPRRADWSRILDAATT
jgi:hypothetical protein